MGRFQFSLRQLLVAIIVVAVALLLVRFALQAHGFAVALLIAAMAFAVLLNASLTICLFLLAFGLVFGVDAHSNEDAQPIINLGPAEGTPLSSQR